MINSFVIYYVLVGKEGSGKVFSEEYRKMWDHLKSPYGYCQCGCGDKTEISTYTNRQFMFAKNEPKRFIKGHALRKSPVDYIREKRGYTTPCWTWQGAKQKEKYGTIRVKEDLLGARRGETITAHRFYYLKYVNTVSRKTDIHHLCKNKDCVNPEHLQESNRSDHKIEHLKSKLSKKDIEEIVTIKSIVDISNAKLAKIYGVNSKTIKDIYYEFR